MGKIIGSIVLMLVVIGLLLGFTFYKYKNPSDLKADADFEDESYDAESGTTSLTCEVEIKNPNHKFGRMVTDFAYVISFKGSDGMTLREERINPLQSINSEDYEAELVFGNGGDYPAIEGKVAKVSVSVTDVAYENISRYRLTMGESKYEDELYTVIIFCFSAVLLFWSVSLDFFLPFPEGAFKSIFRSISMVFLASLGYWSFTQGFVPLLIALLA